MINISKLYCGLGSTSDALRYSASDSCRPVVVYNCTARCNLKCLHCYSYSEANCYGDELTTTEAERMLAQLAKYDCPVVLFSGGEPLLRQDIFELLAESVRLGLRTVLSSNGTLIGRSTAEKLADLGVSYVGISIDGAEEFHDKFRVTKGSFRAGLAGIENCKKAGLKTGLRFTITEQNVGQVSQAFDIASATGMCRLCFYHLVRSGRAAIGTDTARNINNRIQTTSKEQTRAVLDLIIQKTGDFVKKNLIDEVLTVGNHADGVYVLLKMISRNNPLAEQAEKLLLANGGNKVGEKLACIGADGNVYPDQFWRNYSLGKIKDKTFEQIWDNLAEPVLAKLRNKTKFADERCKRCKWFDLCRGNFRFLGSRSEARYWLNEPECYLTNAEIVI